MIGTFCYILAHNGNRVLWPLLLPSSFLPIKPTSSIYTYIYIYSFVYIHFGCATLQQLWCWLSKSDCVKKLCDWGNCKAKCILHCFPHLCCLIDEWIDVEHWALSIEYFLHTNLIIVLHIKIVPLPSSTRYTMCSSSNVSFISSQKL